VSAIGAIVVTLKIEMNPVAWDVGCFGRRLLIAMFPFIVQFYLCRFLWLRISFRLKAILGGRNAQKDYLIFCTMNGLPFTNGQTREVMSALEINVLDVEVPTETYFCVFVDNRKPTFLSAPLQS
jgi:hypothetical protein